MEAKQVTVFHRQGAGAYGHNTADDAAFDASHRDPHARPHHPGAMVARGRVPRGADQHRDGDRAHRRARRRQQAGRLADRNLEPAARAAARHERQRELRRPRRAAAGAAAEGIERRSRRARRRRDAQRLCDLRPAAPPADPPHAAATCRCAPRRCAGSAPGPTCTRSNPSSTNWPRSRAKTRSTYRLSLLSDPRPRRVVETAAQMSGWFDGKSASRRPRPRLRLRALQEHRRLRGGGGRGRGRRGGPPQADLGRRRRRPVITPDGAKTRSRAASSRAPAS